MYVTLRCQKCDNLSCPIARAYVPYDSLEGCTRQVTDDLAAQFHHAVEEVLPFARTAAQFGYIEKTLNEVYQSCIGRRLDSRGKALPESHGSSNSTEQTYDDMECKQDTACLRKEFQHIPDILTL